MKPLFFFLLCAASLGALPELETGMQTGHVQVHNRILAKSNGKPITLLDVIKKMDMVFYQEFPQYVQIEKARFEFYQLHWKHILQELIDKELIMADAEENKVTMTNGEVRQELETLFGPNIIANLDKAGLTFDEAWKLVKEDLLLQRMLLVRVNAKAIGRVTPQDIWKAYEQQTQSKPSEWHYQVLSFRGEDNASCEKIATKAYALLSQEKVPLDELESKLNLHEGVTLSLSEEFTHNENDLSPAYKEILGSLEKEHFSKPLPQKSRNGGALVYRLFYLKDVIPGGPIAFNEVEKNLENKLLSEAHAQEMEVYLKHLRNHFDVQEMALQDFTPFSFQ